MRRESACPALLFFPVCLSRERHICSPSSREEPALCNPGAQGAPVGGAEVCKPLPRVPSFAAPRSSLLSTAKEQKLKEPWQQVKPALHEVPLLCRADMKFLASLATPSQGPGRCDPPDAGDRSHLHWPEIHLKLFAFLTMQNELRSFSSLIQY